MRWLSLVLTNCFTDTRELLKDLPIKSIEKCEQLPKIIMDFLNEVMRPYLSKWGVKFNKWYEIESKKEENKENDDITIQRAYPQYDELIRDLLDVNKKVISYTENLRKIAFNIKETK